MNQEERLIRVLQTASIVSNIFGHTWTKYITALMPVELNDIYDVFATIRRAGDMDERTDAIILRSGATSWMPYGPNKIICHESSGGLGPLSQRVELRLLTDGVIEVIWVAKSPALGELKLKIHREMNGGWKLVELDEAIEDVPESLPDGDPAHRLIQFSREINVALPPQLAIIKTAA